MHQSRKYIHTYLVQLLRLWIDPLSVFAQLQRFCKETSKINIETRISVMSFKSQTTILLNRFFFFFMYLNQVCGFEFESKIDKNFWIRIRIDIFKKIRIEKKFESIFLKKFESILLVGLDPNSNRYCISIHSPDRSTLLISFL